MQTIARQVIVTGNVTGVGFRYSTVRKADRYGDLKGYVRNVDERTVECVVQGPRSQVENLVSWLQKGPPPARVVEYKVREIPVDPSRTDFTVKH